MVGSSGIHSSRHNYQLDIGKLKKETHQEKRRSAGEDEEAGSAGQRKEEKGISKGTG